MWPPHSVKRWRTPARRRTWTTSSPPVTSATSRRPDPRQHLGGEALDLLGSPLDAGDEADDQRPCARLDEPAQRVGALLRRAEHAVLLRQLLEGLIVLPGEVAHGDRVGPRPVV